MNELLNGKDYWIIWLTLSMCHQSLVADWLQRDGNVAFQVHDAGMLSRCQQLEPQFEEPVKTLLKHWMSGVGTIDEQYRQMQLPLVQLNISKSRQA